MDDALAVEVADAGEDRKHKLDADAKVEAMSVRFGLLNRFSYGGVYAVRKRQGIFGHLDA